MIEKIVRAVLVVQRVEQMAEWVSACLYAEQIDYQGEVDRSLARGFAAAWELGAEPEQMSSVESRGVRHTSVVAKYKMLDYMEARKTASKIQT